VIYSAILVCEIAFWAFLLAGLGARYLLASPRLGALLLLGSPVADVALLALTAKHLQAGAAPTQAHALAAAYLGVTVAFGPSLVRWADRRVAFRLVSGPRPVATPRTGHDRLRHEWREFGKAVTAWLITCLILLGLAELVADRHEAQVLLGNIGMLSLVLLIWFATGPLPAAVRARTTGRDGSVDEA